MDDFDPLEDLRADPKTRAERGDASAQYQMGQAYLYGMGVDADPRVARQWFERASQQGHAWSLYDLGQLHEQGVGGPASAASALACYRAAAGRGEARSASRAGFLLRTGLGVPRDREEARRWLSQAAGQDNASAQLQLAILELDDPAAPGSAWLARAASQLEDARILQRALAAARKAGQPCRSEDLATAWRTAAESGAPAALFQWGWALQLGVGVMPDEAAARAAYERASRAKFAPATYYLAVMRAEIVGGGQDLQDLQRGCRPAADQGYAPAQLQMGQYAVMDDAKRRVWLRRAAEQGLPEAEAAYGTELYYHDKSREEGRRWLQRAAEQGHAGAAHTLASSGVLGISIGTPQLSDTQLAWVRRAAGWGLAAAQRQLADHLLAAGGKPGEAVAWLERAAAAGDDDAVGKLVTLYADGKGVARDLTLAARWALRGIELDGSLKLYTLLRLMDQDEAGALPYADIAPVLAREAAKGVRPARTALAELRLKGWGVPRDPAAAQAALTMSAQRGDAHAMVLLGHMAAQGDGVPRDDAAAVRWYEQATVLSGTDGKVPLARMLREGRGVAQDVPRAIKLLEDAASGGLGEADAELGWMFERGLGVPVDLAKALRSFRGAVDHGVLAVKPHLRDFVEAEGRLTLVDGQRLERERRQGAEAGHAQAQYELGTALLAAVDETRDEAAGLNWLLLAGKQGHAAAARELGRVYLNGVQVREGVRWQTKFRDPHAGAAWVERAAELGDDEAQLMLAGVRMAGLTVAPAEALRWTRTVAGKGIAEAQVHMVELCLRGEGVPADPAQAEHWAAVAAAQGEPGGFSALAFAYEQGVGVSKDPAKALHWSRKAAEAGDHAAARLLAEAYEHGKGVAVDLREAIRWHARATEPTESHGAFAIARIYHRGPAAIRNPAEALRWYLTAIDYWIEGGDGTEIFGHGEFKAFAKEFGDLAQARYALARRLERGDGLAQDMKAAATWYARAARLGSKYPAVGVVASFKAASLLQAGAGAPPDLNGAVEHVERGAELLAEQLQEPFSELGRIHENWAFDHAFPPVAAALQKLAKEGKPEAQYWLGWLFTEGRGLPRNDVNAGTWIARAEAGGFVGAKLFVARRALGEPAARDLRAALAGAGALTQAVLAFESRPEAAAALWQPTNALKPVLRAYDKALKAGQVGPYRPHADDERASTRLYQMTADELSEAELRAFARKERISLAYARYFWRTGHLVARATFVKDEMESVKLLKEAAALGSPSAMTKLGTRLELGKGAPKDPVQAYVWYTLAASLGDWEGSGALQRLGATLSAVERARAQDLALAWWEARHGLSARP